MKIKDDDRFYAFSAQRRNQNLRGLQENDPVP